MPDKDPASPHLTMPDSTTRPTAQTKYAQRVLKKTAGFIILILRTGFKMTGKCKKVHQF